MAAYGQIHFEVIFYCIRICYDDVINLCVQHANGYFVGLV